MAQVIHSNPRTTERNNATLSGYSTAGWWLLFFFIIYLILLVKLTNASLLSHNMFFAVYSLTITLYIFSRFLLSYLHAPVYIDSDYEPTITFVVPAMNEEDNIAETIFRFAEVDYPSKKIEVIAINDGSTD